MSRQTFYQVTLPNEEKAITTQPIITGNHAIQHNPCAILFLARFVVLCGANPIRISFAKCHQVVNEALVWTNIFQFLFDPNFFIFSTNTAVGISAAAHQLARFSACIARPSLLLASNEVVYAARHADEALVMKMITVNPNYLLERDVTGETAFQAVLRTGDHVLAEKLAPFFDALPNGQSEKDKQIRAVFPNGYEAHLDQQKKEAEAFFSDIEAENEKLKELVRKFVLQDTSLIQLNDMITRFQEALTEYVKNNRTHNPYMLFEAYGIFDKYCWHYKLSQLISQKVIGFIQKLSTDVWKQHYAQGIYYLGHGQKAEVSTQRFFNLNVNGFCDIRTLDSLGVTSCVTTFGLPDERESRIHRVWHNHDYLYFCNVKIAHFQEILKQDAVLSICAKCI